MKTLFLAFRNLQRNRRRSTTTLVAMMIGVTAILLFGGYALNVNYGLQTGFVQRSGHLQIQHREYFLYGSGDPVSYGIADYRRIIDVVQHDPQLAQMTSVVTPVLAINGIAGNFAAGVSRTVVGSGVVVSDQNRLRAWNDYSFPDASRPLRLTGSGSDAAIIGTGVARVLQLCEPLGVPDCATPGQLRPEGADVKAGGSGTGNMRDSVVPRIDTPPDIENLVSLEESSESGKAISGAQHESRIELLTSSAYGAPNVAELAVVAAQKQGVKEVDDMFVQMHLAQAQQLVYGRGEPKVTSIVIQLHHTSDLQRARARLDTLLQTTLHGEPLEVLDFATINPQYGQVTGMFGAVFGFIAILIATIVMFTVGNTMNMAVMERTDEIGTLRAIGLRAAGVRNMFVCEGVLLGACGAAAGVACSLVLAALINYAGLHWVPPGQTDPVPLTVRIGDPGAVLRASLGLIVIAMLSSWWPARRAARMRIVDALRYA